MKLAEPKATDSSRETSLNLSEADPILRLNRLLVEYASGQLLRATKLFVSRITLVYFFLTKRLHVFTSVKFDLCQNHNQMNFERF